MNTTKLNTKHIAAGQNSPAFFYCRSEQRGADRPGRSASTRSCSELNIPGAGNRARVIAGRSRSELIAAATLLYMALQIVTLLQPRFKACNSRCTPLWIVAHIFYIDAGRGGRSRAFYRLYSPFKSGRAISAHRYKNRRCAVARCTGLKIDFIYL